MVLDLYDLKRASDAVVVDEPLEPSPGRALLLVVDAVHELLLRQGRANPS